MYDSAKLNLSKQSSMTENQKSFNNADSASFVKDEHRGSKHNISPLQMPMIPTFVADLTPTPTRFLRSCDEVGLFNEISKSSYNEDFKRQNSTDESNSVLSSLPSHSQAPIPSVILESIADDNEAEDEASAAALQDQSASNFAISMIETNSQQQLIYSAPQESAANTPTEVAILEPPAERPHIQVLLQLPQGGFVPINIPADALAHATFPGSTVVSVASPVTQVIAPLVVTPGVASTTSSTSGITSTTKQKLKAALQQNIQQQQQLTHQQQQLPQPIAIARASVGRVALPDVSSSSSSHGSGPSVSKTPKLSVNSTVATRDIVRSLSQPLSSQSSDDEEGEGKRKKFLESNRAAANRCRQKKKQWINSLEDKTKQLQEVNRSLTNETSQLRREIAQLKQMLSQHKDCPPVTIISSNVRTDNNF